MHQTNKSFLKTLSRETDCTEMDKTSFIESLYRKSDDVNPPTPYTKVSHKSDKRNDEDDFYSRSGFASIKE